MGAEAGGGTKSSLWQVTSDDERFVPYCWPYLRFLYEDGETAYLFSEGWLHNIKLYLSSISILPLYNDVLYPLGIYIDENLTSRAACTQLVW